MKICICGGGSLGIVCAGYFLNQGHDVRILSGHPEKWKNEISVFGPDGEVFSGILTQVSSNPEDIVSDADIILLCLPGYMIEKTLCSVSRFIRPDSIVGSIVSSTGFFFIAHKVLSNNTKLFGFQRVPFISRIREYGISGDLLGYKKSLNVAIENCSDVEGLRKNLESLFKTPVRVLDNFYEASLTNSNPILHTGRLYSMWKNYDEEIYLHQSQFYSDWTDDASEVLIAMDEEFMKLVKSLHISDGAIPSLLEYYESTDAASLTRKIKSIQAFKGILSPMKEVPNGWIPDFGSRYFTEDFPFGLRFIKELSSLHNIPTPTIDKVYEWGMSKIR